MSDSRLGLPPSPETMAVMKRLPKVDLHRHLEGSLDPEFVLRLAEKYRIPLPASTPEALRSYIQVTDSDRTLLDFIKKFDTLALLFTRRQVVADLTFHVIAAAHADSLCYVELRFAPTYMASRTNLDYREIMEGVLDGCQQAAEDFPETEVGLLVIVNREAPVSKAREMLDLALEYQKHGILGIDLAGDEENYPPEIFAEIFQEARNAGLSVTIHAGEARGAESVETAIRRCHAHRIGHGVKIARNASVEDLVKKERIFLEVCPTSNVQTGAVTHWKEHPICYFLDRQIPLTINSDDPGVSGITLSYEYARLHDLYGISLEVLKELPLRGLEASFLSPEEKKGLRNRLEAELAGL